ncbi:hypothetical protein PSH84_12995 [Pseudomonas beijingensis]|uniref:EpsG family protein n=1 Tax=Pseudomonas beijingensis TaxID=2954101 RepID=A0ABY9FH39_9PSED|nr:MULTISPECIES: hypothetical protein [unclassified Pseudomonas]WLH02861.1 hypothetical protein PSH92_08320 [Pseudomonas sp. FP2034]WLI47693.1 hypothetical protein PSH84_12995 [Pseudomonas sp. FP830]
MKLYMRKSTFLLFFFAVSAVLFYAFLGRYMLSGEIDFKFFADSLTYEKLYQESDFKSFSEMISWDSNYFGPLVILEVFGGDRVLVLCFNIALAFISLWLVRTGDQYDWVLFVFLFFLSPITFSSLLSINKEIISLLTMSLLVAWLFRRSAGYLILAFISSFLVRWQLSLFILVVFSAFSSINPLRHQRVFFLALLLSGISIVYFFIGDQFVGVNSNADRGAAIDEGSGAYVFLNDAQRNGLYFLVFIPKALHAMYGLVFRVGNVFDFNDVYNNVVVTLHCLVAFLFFLIIFFRRRLRLSDDLIFIAVIYCSIFVLTPIYSPRYFYPVFFLSCLVLARRSEFVGVVKNFGSQARLG